jgi:hypothetical protein
LENGDGLLINTATATAGEAVVKDSHSVPIDSSRSRCSRRQCRRWRPACARTSRPSSTVAGRG